MPSERRETITTPDRGIEAKMLKNGYIQRGFRRSVVSAPFMGCFASSMSFYAIGRAIVVTAITSAKKIARMAENFRHAPGDAVVFAASPELIHPAITRNAPAPRQKAGA